MLESIITSLFDGRFNGLDLMAWMPVFIFIVCNSSLMKEVKA